MKKLVIGILGMCAVTCMQLCAEDTKKELVLKDYFPDDESALPEDVDESEQNASPQPTYPNTPRTDEEDGYTDQNQMNNPNNNPQQKYPQSTNKANQTRKNRAAPRSNPNPSPNK